MGFDEKEPVPLEEALNVAGVGLYSYRALIICFLLLLVVVTQIFGRMFIMTASSCDLGLTTYRKSIIGAMPMLGIVLSAHLWGWLADTRGRKKVLMISLVGSWMVSMCGSLSIAWPMLALSGFFTAFFISASNSIGFALLGESIPQRVRSVYILMMSNGVWMGQAFNTGLAYVILNLDFKFRIPLLGIYYRPWRFLELCYGLTSGLLALLLFFFVKESPKFYVSIGKTEEGLQVLREIYSINHRKKPEEFPVTNIVYEKDVMVRDKNVSVLMSFWNQTTPLFRPPLLRNTLIISYIVIVCYTITPSIMLWMPSISNAYNRALEADAKGKNFCDLINYGISNTNSTEFLLRSTREITATSGKECNEKVSEITYIVVPVFSMFLMALNLLCIAMLKYVQKRSLVMFIYGSTGAVGVGMYWIKHNVFSGLVLFLFLTNVLCMGLCSNFAVEMYPTYLRSTAVCLSVMIGRAFTFFMLNVIGELLANYYCNITIFTLATIVISGAFVGFLLPRDKT